MKFSLPYVSGIGEYINRLPSVKREKIYDIYFSDNRLNPSNRFAWYDDDDIEDTKWGELLQVQEQHGIYAHYVVNPSVWHNNVYSSGMQDIKTILDKVWRKGVKWLTINNPLLLRQKEFREDIPPFKIKLSINNHISSLEEVVFAYENNNIQHIILDRNINRNMDELKRIHEWSNGKNISFTLLAQEGCITQCQWKQSCDNMISTFHRHDVHEVNDAQNVHTLNLCTKYYNDKPAEILKSPWILPGAITLFEPYVDYIKLSGRERSIVNMIPSFDAYLNGDDNILIRDIVPKCSNKIGSKNALELQALGASSKWSNCKNRCIGCDFCDTLYNRIDG